MFVLKNSVGLICVHLAIFVVLIVTNGCTTSDDVDQNSLEKPRTEDQTSLPTNEDPESTVSVDEESETAENQLSSAECEPFLQAAFSGDSATIADFLQTHPDQIDVCDPDSRTALMLASFNGHAAIVEKLLNAKAQVNLKDVSGRTALMYAATGTDLKVVSLLVAQAAEVNAVDNIEHWSPLMFAASEGQIRIVQHLLDNGANKDAKDIDGEDSIDFARSNEHSEVVWLLENFAKK